jgi:cell division protein DivIC
MGVSASVHGMLTKLGIKIKRRHVNKFTITGFIFVVWISFIDRYNFIVQYKLSRTISYLENEKERYEANLAQAIIDRETLKNDKEKFAREKYYMHKENEEVIILE